MSFVPANSGISKLKPYQPGKPISELERELGLTDIVKLASNENPLGCSDKVKEAVAAEISEIGRYPDGGGFILKDQIKTQFGFNHDQITLGNGSNDLLEMFARAFVSENDSVVYSQHAFAVYALVTQAINAQAIEVPAKGFSHDLEAMAVAIQDNTKLVFIANPNNPTGTWFEEAEFEAFMQKVPANVIVVLDEAYVEYFPENFNSLKFLAQYPNKAGMAQLEAGFKALGLNYVPSRANFILVDVQADPSATFNGLLKQGVIVRPVGIFNHIRVSIGTETENAKFLSALAKVLGLEAKA